MTSDGKFAYNLVPETATLSMGNTDAGMAPATSSREQRFSPPLAAYTLSTAYFIQTETDYQRQSVY
jgi:hypothetical protein